MPVLGPVLLGAVVGLGWWLLAPTAAVVQLQGGTLLASTEPELAAAQDGWLVVLEAVAGVLCGVVAAVRAGSVPWRRSLLVVAGSALGSVLALGVGWLLGPASVAAQLAGGATSAEGLLSPLRVHSTGVLLVWPAVAALAMTAGHLAAAWASSSRVPRSEDATEARVTCRRR